MNRKFFYLDESPLYPGNYSLRLHVEMVEEYFPNGSRGSYNLIAARLLNLPFADYLRYCRDRLGAEIIGRNRRYPYPMFPSQTKEARALCDLLNARMELVVRKHEHPYEYTRDSNGEVVRTTIEANEN